MSLADPCPRQPEVLAGKGSSGREKRARDVLTDEVHLLAPSSKDPKYEADCIPRETLLNNTVVVSDESVSASMAEDEKEEAKLNQPSVYCTVAELARHERDAMNEQLREGSFIRAEDVVRYMGNARIIAVDNTEVEPCPRWLEVLADESESE